METNLNGIVLNGSFYEAIPKGSKHCSDCSLFLICDIGQALCVQLEQENGKRVIFRFSPELTEKLKGE